MDKMNSAEFISAITQEGSDIKVSDQTIVEPIFISGLKIINGLRIKNCTFEDGVYFDNVKFNGEIQFINCTFKKELSIIGCVPNDKDEKFNYIRCHFHFKMSIIRHLDFKNSQIENGITILDNCEIEILQINKLSCSNGFFSIFDSKIKQQLSIFDLTMKANFEIENDCEINAPVFLKNISCTGISFIKSTFKEEVNISNGEIKGLVFDRGLFYDDLNVNAVSVSLLSIINTEFKKSIVFYLKDNSDVKAKVLNNIFIDSAKFGEQFILNGNNTEINNLTIKLSKQFDGALHFNSNNILNTTITGNNYNANITFNKVSFNKISFDYFNNYSTISIISAESYSKDSVFKIDHSNLGKTHFFNTSLNSFDKIEIQNSILIDILTANVTWFDDKKLNPNDSKSTEYYSQRKEIYRQIKFALEKQGDRISSLHFKALEMKAYKEEGQKKFNDKFILWFGQINDFGITWWKPVLWAVVITLVFYFLMLVEISDKLSWMWIPNLNTESFKITYEEFCNHSAAIPQLLNPASNLKNIFPISHFSCLVYSLFYLFKIILSYLIFQVIFAFRKYIK